MAWRRSVLRRGSALAARFGRGRRFARAAVMLLQYGAPSLSPGSHTGGCMGVTVELFRNETEVERFGAGDTIFREGDPGEAMYVVVEGTVEVSTHSGRLKEVVGPGDVIGEMALIDQGPRAASAVAKTDCQLARIPEKRFLFMVRETPYFALQIMRIMAERLRRMVGQR